MSRIGIENKDFDFIVVGGGTAGNVVAGRLAENPDVSVLVIEAGERKPLSPEIATPALAFDLRGSEDDWQYKSTFIDRPEYTRIEQNTRGKTLGGSSALNYYTWIPGSKATYDEWEEFGGAGWNWNNVHHYFSKCATYYDDEGLYPSELKKLGTDGPLPVAHSQLVPELEPFRRALKEAWESKGQNYTDDIYSGIMAGMTPCVTSIYNGIRSSSHVFIEGKPNVTILDQTHSKKLVMVGDICKGVVVYGANKDDEITFMAKQEVILSSGVFESPKLLMLSGIGPKEHLASHGIQTIVDSPHVGKNLLDHPIMPYCMRLKDGLGLEDHLLRAGPAKDGAVQAYRRDHSGPLSSGLLEMIALPRVDHLLANNRQYQAAKKANDGLDPYGPAGQPHFEVDFVPMFSSAFQYHIPAPKEGSWLTVIVDLLRPQSKNGYVKLRSSDPLEQPEINLKFFDNDLDLVVLREGVRMISDILTTGDGMKDIIGEDYPFPMPRHSDEAMRQTILERSQTGYHPCGTTRLSKSIEQGVVDPALKVHGVKNLRVIDASIFPQIPDCRIQMGVYMTAEKGADLIKADYPELYK